MANVGDRVANAAGDIKDTITGQPGGTHRWEDAMPAYRNGWQERHGQRGGRWEEQEPYYRYGWEMQNQPQYRGRAWSDAEHDVRRDWEATNRRPAWDQASQPLGEAWQTIQLLAEELRVRKERVQAGEVTVRKEVISEQQTVNVPVTHEEVVVERHAVNRPAGSADFREEEVRVPVSEERVHAEKDVVTREEVSVGTRAVQETEHLSGTVRHEELRIEKEGDVTVRDNRGDRGSTKR